jgi:Transposase DDE domain
MATSSRRSRTSTAQIQSFWDCLRYFLTPQIWKQAHQALRQSIRWQAHSLIMVLLTMTWCCGDSVAERFETAKAFYVASYQRKRRPGKTIEGFHKALARIPTRALRQVAAALRQRLVQVFGKRLLVDGFVPLGCDGSRLNCPRTPQLERRLRSKRAQKQQQPPMVWLTAFVHLSLGVLWSWRLGGPHADERQHLVKLLETLPSEALVVADAGYVGYPLLHKLQSARRWFLIRLTSMSPLYVPDKNAIAGRSEGLVYYWPQQMQQQHQPPIRVRFFHFRARQGRQFSHVWLITNVLDRERLHRSTARKFYRWRWRNEGLFRTYKRTLGKVKLLSHTVVGVHREAEGSLLAVQLLLAQGALALQFAGESANVLPSARHVLLEIRAEIRNVTGMYLGPRQRQTYLERLQNARQDRRRHRHNQVRRRWPNRKDHRSPRAPKILKMGTMLKELLAKVLSAA